MIQRWWESGVSPCSIEFKQAIDVRLEELGDAVWRYTPIADI